MAKKVQDKKKNEKQEQKKSEKKYVNPILAWVLVGGAFAIAITIGLAVLLNIA